jgi:anti-sigma factor ChrR (cupin superfamily)
MGALRGANLLGLQLQLTMLLHTDFSHRATVTAHEHRWVPSPQAGVERVMLDRLGGEQARATSLVRYAPASLFPAHGHPGGEEILVLSGTFSDGSGHYGPGWYLRNPPGSAHQPSSADGALIFVKLWQMPADDTRTVRIDTRDPAAWRPDGTHEVCLLHRTDQEHVRLLRLPPGHALHPDAQGGAELLVLEGRLVDGATVLGPLDWLRTPPGDASELRAGACGVTVYLKSGHLAGLAT